MTTEGGDCLAQQTTDGLAESSVIISGQGDKMLAFDWQ